jgi:hypothetical protein
LFLFCHIWLPSTHFFCFDWDLDYCYWRNL